MRDRGRMAGRCVPCLMAAVLLAGCQGAGPPPLSEPALPPVAVAPESARVFRVDAAASRVRFIVRRGGTLARLGHNHVILARRIDGAVRWAADPTRSTVELSLPVDGFEVDPADERAALGEGFGPVPESAVKGTRANMLGEKVLDAARFPEVRVHTVRVAPATDGYLLTLRIELYGTRRDLTVPVSVTRTDDRLRAQANFTIKQTDFGMTPLSVLGGALQVEDAVAVRVDLVASARTD